MSNFVIKVDTRDGCNACPFEHAGRCFALEQLYHGAFKCPEESVHEECPLQDGQTIDVMGVSHG